MKFTICFIFIIIIIALIVPHDSFAQTKHVSIPQGTSVPGCEVTNECFVPYQISIDPGGEVIWSNDDSAAHTVTSGTATGGPDGNFDSSLFMAGTTFSVVFDDKGEYPYFCMVHPWMIGNVIVGSTSSSSGSTSKSSTIKVDTTNFVLSYKITGGSVLSVTPDDDANSLVVAIKTTSDGVLTITLPRALIDAKINGQDDNFFVLIDGEEVEFEETVTSIDRTLTIAFPDGAKEIEIIGSFVSSHTSSSRADADITIPQGTSIPGCEENNQCFIPAVMNVDVGGEVTWSNDDSAAHTVTSGTAKDGPDGNFDSSLFMEGTTFSVKFDEKGEYPYFCMVHPWMIGLITVGGLPEPKITYYDTKLSLEITDGSSVGNIKVYPTLSYGQGSALSLNSVEIDVDGSLKTVVSSNQWSNDIWAGSGSHTIGAKIQESTNPSDSSVKYRSSSVTESYVVTPPPTNLETFPMEYIIIFVAVAVAAGIAISLLRRKKSVPKVTISGKTQTTPEEDTQFWVCPHCGKDTQYKNGKQFCSSCNMYL